MSNDSSPAKYDDDDIGAAATALVARLPATHGEMTVASIELMVTFLERLRDQGQAVIGAQEAMLKRYGDSWPDDMSLDQAIELGLIPEEAMLEVAGSEAEWVQLQRAQMVIMAWQAIAGHPLAFDRGPLSDD
jgi:hypothetical protein